MNHFFKRFYYAGKGIRAAFGEQFSLKIQLFVALLVVVAGFYLGISVNEWIAVIFAIGIVISLEMFNTAIEYIVNMISPGQHPMAGKIKDIAAGAVLIASIMSVIVGIVIFAKFFHSFIP